MYNSIHFNNNPIECPFIFRGQLQNRFGTYFYYNPPIIPLCAPDEVFLWLTHSQITPNIIENRYLVSNYGRVYDCYKNVFVTLVSKHCNGYHCVYLYHYKDSYSVESLNIKLHRLVAFYFLYFEGCHLLQVNHINGNKKDNRACNLEWVTSSENIAHAIRTGLVPIGKAKGNMPITDAEADKICQLIVEGKSNLEIANMMGVTPTLVLRIKTGESYTNISRKYPNIKNNMIKSAPNLTDDKVHQICKLLLEGYTLDRITEIIGCTRTQVENVRKGRNYTNISSQYNLDEKLNIKRYTTKETIHLICKDMENPDNTNNMLAQKYGISNSTISQIRTRKCHSDISSQYNIQQIFNNRRNLSEVEVREICESLTNKVPCSEIIKHYNVSQSTIYAIKNRTSYTNISDEYPNF